MNNARNATYSDPTIHFLTQILNQVREGTIRIPRFQRPFVWSEERQLELLRSIRQGIPIGALMVWKTSESSVRFYDNLAGLPIAQDIGGIAQQYLLDGVQRITTLYAALTNRPAAIDLFSDDVQETPRPVYFSFVDDDFVFAKNGDELEGLMPLSVITDTLSLIKYQRKLALMGIDAWLTLSDEIAFAFREYKVPIIPIATNDLDVATLTFQRVNHQGEPMSDLHMIHALTWSKDFDLQDRMTSAVESHLSPIGWGGIDSEIILKVCKGFLDLNLYKTEPKKLSMLLRQRTDLVEYAVTSIAGAAGHLKNAIGVEGPNEVPYAFQIVFASLCAGDLGLPGNAALFRDWFWFTTYAEAFSGMSDDRVSRALIDFKVMLFEQRPVWTDRKKSSLAEWKLERFDIRSVRSKALLLNLARRIQDHTGQNAFDDLHVYGRDTLHYFYPRNLVGGLATSLGNRFLSAPKISGDFHFRWETGLLTDEERMAHFLGDEVSYENPFSMIERRALAISSYINGHIQETAHKFLTEALFL